MSLMDSVDKVNLLTLEENLLIDSKIENLEEFDKKKFDEAVISICYDRNDCLRLEVDYYKLDNRDMVKIFRLAYVECFS